MKATETSLPGAWHIEIERIEDERGFFARTFCRNEFAELGIDADIAQCNTSYNEKRGTLRGMHFQRSPGSEAKLVRCTAGAIYDVIVDLRSDSPTHRQWIGMELTAEQRNAVFVPAGFAHGFQTLTDDAEVFYQMSDFYRPEFNAGFRWDDSEVAITWPMAPTRMSDTDRSLPVLTEVPLDG